jgi:hypothetical protein
MQACAGPRGMARQSGYQCRPVQTWGTWPSRREIMRVWISRVAVLEGLDRQSRDPAGLCRPEGRGLMEWISVLACADLRSMAQWKRDHVC